MFSSGYAGRGAHAGGLWRVSALRINTRLVTQYRPGLGEVQARSRAASPLDPVFRPYARRLRPAWPDRPIGKPLVYSTLFGSDFYEDCLDLTLMSLHRYGGYRGDVLLLTDRPAAGLRRRFGPYVAGELTIQPIDYADLDTAMLQRFRLAEFGVAAQGPFLHLDSDILVLAPIAPLLAAASASDKLLIATEDRFCPGYHGVAAQDLPEDGVTDWYGVWLMKQRASAIAQLRFANAGAFAFGRLAPFAALFAEVLEIGLAQRGTRFAHFGDQPIFNILLHEQNIADFTTLDAMMDYLRPVSRPSRGRLMHFNSMQGGAAKYHAMRAFLDACAVADD